MIGRDVPWSGRGRGKCERTRATAQAAGGSRPDRTREPAVPIRARLPRRTATTRTPSPSARRQGVQILGTRPDTETRAATGRATTGARVGTRARAAPGTRAPATETRPGATGTRAPATGTRAPATGTRPAATGTRVAEPEAAGRCPIPRPGGVPRG